MTAILVPPTFTPDTSGAGSATPVGSGTQWSTNDGDTSYIDLAFAAGSDVAAGWFDLPTGIPRSWFCAPILLCAAITSGDWGTTNLTAYLTAPSDTTPVVAGDLAARFNSGESGRPNAYDTVPLFLSQLTTNTDDLYAAYLTGDLAIYIQANGDAPGTIRLTYLAVNPPWPMRAVGADGTVLRIGPDYNPDGGLLRAGAADGRVWQQGMGAVPPDADSFTRADAIDMGSTELQGVPWNVVDGGGADLSQLGVQDDQARNYAGAPFGHTSTGYAWIDGLTPDGTVTYKIAAHAISQAQGTLIFRYVDTDNWWGLSVGPFAAGLTRSVAGVGTAVGGISPPSFVAGDEWSVSAIGDQIEVFCNGVSVDGPFTSTVHQTATKVGFEVSWPQWIVDWSWAPEGTARPLRYVSSDSTVEVVLPMTLDGGTWLDGGANWYASCGLWLGGDFTDLAGLPSSLPTGADELDFEVTDPSVIPGTVTFAEPFGNYQIFDDGMGGTDTDNSANGTTPNPGSIFWVVWWGPANDTSVDPMPTVSPFSLAPASLAQFGTA